MIPSTIRTAAAVSKTAVGRAAAAAFLLLVATILCCTKTATTKTVVVAFQQQQQYSHHNTPRSVLHQQSPKDEFGEAAQETQQENKKTRHTPNEELGTKVRSRNHRRAFVLNSLALLPFAALITTRGTIEPAYASGGATAGGAYLLSAKKRYYERVKSAVHGLVAVNTALQQPEVDLSVAKGYFSPDNTDDGSWKDLTAAGYLLSNAFRRSSSTAPDSLPAVKVRVTCAVCVCVCVSRAMVLVPESLFESIVVAASSCMDLRIGTDDRKHFSNRIGYPSNLHILYFSRRKWRSIIDILWCRVAVEFNLVNNSGDRTSLAYSTLILSRALFLSPSLHHYY